RGIASIPDELTSVEAAPLLCAGITTYNALRNAGLRGGDLVAVQGIGGLGHLGIQFARHMGFRTVAIGRGREKEKLAKDLGAHLYIDTAVEDAAAVLQRMGGAGAILQQPPVVMRWDHLCPVLQPAARSSWWVYRRTRSN